MIFNKKIFWIIFFGLIISISLSLFNISKFDKNIILKDGSLGHKMIKSDISCDNIQPIYEYIQSHNKNKS